MLFIMYYLEHILNNAQNQLKMKLSPILLIMIFCFIQFTTNAQINVASAIDKAFNKSDLKTIVSFAPDSASYGKFSYSTFEYLTAENDLANMDIYRKEFYIKLQKFIKEHPVISYETVLYHSVKTRSPTISIGKLRCENDTYFYILIMYVQVGDNFIIYSFSILDKLPENFKELEY